MPDKPVTVRVEGTRDGVLTQRIEARAHSFVADEPHGIGDDLGPTPYELLLAALGACTSMTLQMYARQKGIALESVSVRLTYNRVHVEDCEDSEAPKRRVHQIERDIGLIGDLTGAERQRLLEIAERCPVHRTLEEEKQILTRLS